MTIDRKALEKIVKPLRKRDEEEWWDGYGKAVLKCLLAHRVTKHGERFNLQEADVLCKLAEELERKRLIDTSTETSRRFARKLDELEPMNGSRFGDVLLAIQSGALSGVEAAIQRVEPRKVNYGRPT